MRRPIFLDRDGVLNKDVAPYVRHRDQFEIFPWTVKALTLLDQAGFDIFVVTNQQGVSLGLTPQEELDACHELLQDAIRPTGFQIKKIYACTAHNGVNHPWRKPSPGMILAAQEEFGVEPKGAFMIGDKWTDIECGARAGCRPLLVLTGVTPTNDTQSWQYPPERVFENLLEAVKWVVSADADASSS